MSPLPIHNRPLMGRRLGLSIDLLLWVFCKYYKLDADLIFEMQEVWFRVKNNNLWITYSLQ